MAANLRRWRAWLDADGLHVWVEHHCVLTIVKTMLPHPQWRARNNTWDNGAKQMLVPPVVCGMCNSEIVDHPIDAFDSRDLVQLEEWLAAP